MDIRPEMQIRTMIKAMNEVVLPAIDPSQKMAQEQARLVIGTLQFIAERLPIAYRYDRDELTRYVKLANNMLNSTEQETQSTVRSSLKVLVMQGEDVLERARAEPQELEQSIFALRSSVSDLVQESNGWQNTESRSLVAQLVLQAAKVELQRERALVERMGFESDPSKVPPPITEQLPPFNFSVTDAAV